MDIPTIISTLQKAGVNCSIVGGYAVALHGAVRGTIDLDLVIEHVEAQFVACEHALLQLGFKPKLPVSAAEVFKFREEYITRRNLVAWSFYHPTNPIEVIDIIITDDLRNMRSIFKKAGLEKIPVISLDDLIAMKQRSARPQDLEDVKMLEAIRNDKS